LDNKLGVVILGLPLNLDLYRQKAILDSALSGAVRAILLRHFVQASCDSYAFIVPDDPGFSGVD
jgi:hypothetical protein